MDICRTRDVIIDMMATDKDHIHLLVDIPHTQGIDELIKILKQRTTWIWNTLRVKVEGVAFIPRFENLGFSAPTKIKLKTHIQHLEVRVKRLETPPMVHENDDEWWTDNDYH